MHTLTLTTGTSRGRDTYGYALVTITDSRTGKRYRASGGGYDMRGAVFGNWLQDVYQAELQAIGHLAGSHYSKAGGYQSHKNEYGNPSNAYLYGMTRNDDTGRITLDGACGFRSMELIAEALGLTVNAICDRRGNPVAFTVSARESAAA